MKLFGAGRFARDVALALAARGTPAGAFLTSGEPAAATLDGLPWRRLSPGDLADDDLWIAVFNHQRHCDYGALTSWLHGVAGDALQLHWPQAWYASLQHALGFRFWLQDPSRYAGVEPEWRAARAHLDDQASRTAFDAIIAFRRDASHFATPPAPVSDTQYLPDWLLHHLQERGTTALRIADGGAYQGETLRELAARMPIERAWAFEPDAANHRALTQGTTGIALRCLRAGLSERPARLAFAGGAGGASHLSESGIDTVDVLPLDDALAGERINFLKLDVEGHELQALAGARETLRRCRPVLAIAAYHRWDDLWRLPAFVASLGLGYRQRLVVHQHNSFDTVLYAF